MDYNTKENALSIRVNADSTNDKFVIVDRNENVIAKFERLSDCTLCFRYMVGKSMPKEHADYAFALLRNAEGQEPIKKYTKPNYR